MILLLTLATMNLFVHRTIANDLMQTPVFECSRMPISFCCTTRMKAECIECAVIQCTADFYKKRIGLIDRDTSEYDFNLEEIDPVASDYEEFSSIEVDFMDKLPTVYHKHLALYTSTSATLPRAAVANRSLQTRNEFSEDRTKEQRVFRSNLSLRPLKPPVVDGQSLIEFGTKNSDGDLSTIREKLPSGSNSVKPEVINRISIKLTPRSFTRSIQKIHENHTLYPVRPAEDLHKFGVLVMKSFRIQPHNATIPEMASTTPQPECGKWPDFIPCVPPLLADNRFKECCRQKLLPVGCQNLCRYTVTLSEIKTAVDRAQCGVLYVAAIVECASDGNDNTECCRSRDIAVKSGPQCETFCKPGGGLRGLGLQHLVCNKVLVDLIDCHYAGLRYK